MVEPKSEKLPPGRVLHDIDGKVGIRDLCSVTGRGNAAPGFYGRWIRASVHEFVSETVSCFDCALIQRDVV